MTSSTLPAARPDARAWHYGEFYGLREAPGDAPILLVAGNCQAESLRVMLDAGDLRAIRMPPIHEIVATDLPHLDAWLSRADLLVAQPIRDGYHDMPLGTAQLASRLPAGAVVATVPVVRFAGLYPTHAIIRPPRDPGLSPPVVPYHDLRFLAEAAGDPVPPLTTGAVRAIADLSRAELRRRETAAGAVPLSDLFDRPRFALLRTINHPGNEVWAAAAERVRERLGLPERAVDPGRELLDGIHAPREAVVVEAWGLDDGTVADWRVDGQRIPVEEMREAHLRWYADNPDVVAAGVARHATALTALAA